MRGCRSDHDLPAEEALFILVHFYKTAEKRPFKSFWQVGTAALTPMPIPEFTPLRWRARRDGIVV